MSAYADLTNLADVLKNVYGTGLTNQFEDEKITYNLFPKSDRKPTGNGYIFGVRYSRAQGTGSRAESAKLPDPFTGTKDQGTIKPKYNYGSIRITGPAIEAAKGNTAAFVDGLADEIDDIYQSIVSDLNRQSHWDGFGQIGRMSSATSAPSATTWTATFDNDIGVMYFQEGMLVDIYATAGATIVGSLAGARVLSVVPSTKTVNFEAMAAAYISNHPYASGYTNTGATTVAVGAIAVKVGARALAWASTDVPTEITGLRGFFDSTSYTAQLEGITVASNPKWAANVISNSDVNRELSIDLMINACDLTRTRSGKKVDQIRFGLGQRRKYANLLLPDVRFAPTILKGGYETLTFSGGDGSIEMIVDPMTLPNVIYFQPAGIIQKYEMTPLGWGNLDGSQLHQRAGYDEWDAYLRIFTQLGVEQRNCLTVIRDLVEPSLY
jgi:hypothetical protein